MTPPPKLDRRPKGTRGTDERLLDLGYEVIPVPHDGGWEELVTRYRSIFGGGP